MPTITGEPHPKRISQVMGQQRPYPMTQASNTIPSSDTVMVCPSTSNSDIDDLLPHNWPHLDSS